MVLGDGKLYAWKVYGWWNSRWMGFGKWGDVWLNYFKEEKWKRWKVKSWTKVSRMGILETNSGIKVKVGWIMRGEENMRRIKWETKVDFEDGEWEENRQLLVTLGVGWNFKLNLMKVKSEKRKTKTKWLEFRGIQTLRYGLHLEIIKYTFLRMKFQCLSSVCFERFKN